VSTAIITGAGGLIGSEAARHFHSLGWDVVGVDNDMRSKFFGVEASTRWMTTLLAEELPNYEHQDFDIRDTDALSRLFARVGPSIELVVHAAAQPSHDWAARDPITDFEVNARGTMNMLEAARRHAADAPFVFLSTNKVYGDTPNNLPLVELETRYELPTDHPWYFGVPESMSIDHCTHSLFGVSKAAGDLLVQEYGRYFDMPTVVLRGGCLTGPGHSGAELHGFLAYLIKCVATGRRYTIYGYKGKQVRDNIHSADLVKAIEQIARSPQAGAVYNIGGGREANCSLIEAVNISEEIAGQPLKSHYVESSRVGDHLWWIGDLATFKADYPEWGLTYDIRSIIAEIYDLNRERWRGEAA